jgi:FMN phosphatase YigB (HAD superfamily)
MIFFIDDSPANVAAARDCGWTAAVWTGNDTLGALMTEQ